jgi:hypothetical protein
MGKPYVEPARVCNVTLEKCSYTYARTHGTGLYSNSCMLFFDSQQKQIDKKYLTEFSSKIG